MHNQAAGFLVTGLLKMNRCLIGAIIVTLLLKKWLMKDLVLKQLTETRQQRFTGKHNRCL